MKNLRMKAARAARNLSQQQLAELVGARRETIVHLENGKYNPSLKLAMEIAKVFHVPLFSFVGDER